MGGGPSGRARRRPLLGSGTAPTGHASDPATVTVSSKDPVPTGCSLNACIASGVDHFQWWLDSNVPVNGGNSAPVAATDANGNSTASISIQVPSNQWGTHTLYVDAVDKAGNRQPTSATYTWYAPWNPAGKIVQGDLTGDGIPDMLATTNDGNLTLIRGNSDLSAAPEIASTPAQSPDRSGWNNYVIAHRGSITQQNVDDLFAYNKSSPSHPMYSYKNDAVASPPGTAGHFSLTQDISVMSHPTCQSVPATNCTGYPTDWSQLSQMAAPGPLSLAAYNAANPTAKQALAPDLITVEGNKLWYLTSGGSPSSFYGAYLIGTGDWSNTTLVGVGMVGASNAGTTASTLSGTPTLWVRNNTTGAISSYPLTFDNQGNPTTNITAPTNAALVSGVVDTSNKNMCLDIYGAITTDGTKAEMWSCNGGSNQTFTLGTDNTIHVLGKCLDVNGAGTGNGTLVQLWTCNNAVSQQWVPGPFAGALLNPNSGRCLADPAASNTPGTQLIIWDCLTGHAEQNWAATNNNVLPATQPILPLGINSTTYPAITTPGDVNGDGNPDLYAITGDGRITSFPGTTPSPVAPPTDRWKLTDTTNAVRSTNGLTLNGSATIAADSTRGNVFKGNGTTAYANSAATSVNTSQSFTVTAWVNLGSAIPTQNATAVAQDGTQNSGFYLQYNNANRSWCLTTMANDTATSTGSGLSPCSTTATTANTWVHLAGVYDAIAKTAKLYVNGNLAATTTGLTNWSASGSLTIGAALYHGARADYFPGSISDVKTYSTALPAASILGDVANIAQFSPSTTLGYLQQPTDRWKLTDPTDSIRPNTLALTGGATFTTDATRGTVLNLDGATGTRASTPGTVFDTTKSYTVSAWAYLTNTNSFANVVGESGTNASAFYLQYSRSFSAWTFTSPSTDSTGAASYSSAYASSPPALNTWTHLVGVYDASTQTMSLYINGTLVSTATNPSAWAATGPLTIGNAKNENPFPGKISDVQTWNTALSAGAIATLNSGTQPVPIQLS